MRDFIFDAKPKTTEESVSLKNDAGKCCDYKLKRVKNNGCVFAMFEGGMERDSVVFTMQDLRALYLLLTVSDGKDNSSH